MKRDKGAKGDGMNAIESWEVKKDDEITHSTTDEAEWKKLFYQLEMWVDA